MRIVEITHEPVELYKILKFEGLVTTGGEAKLLIGDGQVTVNGEVETRRRRKILNADVIEFRGDRLQIQLLQEDAARTEKPS
jgi:ribosome-associated protein